RGRGAVRPGYLVAHLVPVVGCRRGRIAIELERPGVVDREHAAGHQECDEERCNDRGHNEATRAESFEWPESPAHGPASLQFVFFAGVRRPAGARLRLPPYKQRGAADSHPDPEASFVACEPYGVNREEQV